MSVWLELNRADAIDEDQKVMVNFDHVAELEWIEKRRVTVLVFSTGFRREVKEDPTTILRVLEGGTT
jgi:hypothetical protein